MVDFPRFASYMEKIQDCNDWMDELYKLNINLFETPVDDILSNFVDFLAREMHDTNEWISWYCWETDFGRDKNMNQIEVDGETITIDNFKALYEFITEEGK